SVRHLSGTGCPNEGDVPFLPTTQPITASPVDPFSVDYSSSFLPSFSHADEGASAGYYRVGLNPKTPSRIGAELTATTCTGLARHREPDPDRGPTVRVRTPTIRSHRTNGCVRHLRHDVETHRRGSRRDLVRECGGRAQEPARRNEGSQLRCDPRESSERV